MSVSFAPNSLQSHGSTTMVKRRPATVNSSFHMSVQKIKFMLMAQDMERALKFHIDVFGFAKGFQNDHWSEMMHGETIIAFHGGHDGSPHPTGLSIQVEDAHATSLAIEAAGGTIIDTPYQRDGEPIKLGFFRDREGNEIMLTEWMG
jgi:predicted enzyme related to lactoylglutathione lyase